MGGSSNSKIGNGLLNVPRAVLAATMALAVVFVLVGIPVQMAHAATAPDVTVTRASTGKLTMKRGATYKLAAKASAGKLTYKSSKKKVVTVSKKGVLKAKKSGKATITVKAKEGAKAAAKKVKVTVVAKNKFKAVKKVTAKASSSKLEVGKTAKINVAFKPKKPSNINVTFQSSAPSVLSVDAYGNVTAKKAGKATVTVTSCDNSKAKAKIAFTVTQPAPADRPSAKPSLGELHTYTSSFVEGSDDAKCVFEVRAENVSTINLKAGDSTYAMNDSGVDGDEEEDDGIWSATIDFTSLHAGESVECKATSGDLEAGPLTVTAFPAWSEELQAQAMEQAQTASDAVCSAVADYVDDETGYVETEEDCNSALAALEESLKQLVDNGSAISYEMGPVGGSVKLSSGLNCMFALPIEGMQASGDDVKVEFWCADLIAGDPSEGMTLYKRLQGDEVTCKAVIDDMPHNSLVWWYGHGSFADSFGPALLLTEKYWHAIASLGYADAWVAAIANRIGMNIPTSKTGLLVPDVVTDATVILDAGFFDKYRPNMSGDIFIASTCCGAEDDRLAMAMRRCGCKGFFGFSDVVTTQYDNPLSNDMVKSLMSGATLGDALSKATSTWGDSQYDYFASHDDIRLIVHTNNCVPKIIYGENFSLNRKAVSCSTGESHFAALAFDGSLWTWGRNDYGQLGNGTFEDCNVPSEIMDDVVSFSAGYGYSAAVKKNGSLWTWGWNYDGRLGDGTTENRSSPVKIMSGAASVVLASSCAAAIKTDGSLYIWGNPSFMQDGTSVFYATPTKIMDNVASVSLAGGNIAVIKKDGSLWTWGNNVYGQLGDGTHTNRFKPVKIMDGVASVSLGGSHVHSAAIKNDGTLWTWGSGEDGMLGDGSTTDRSTPVKIMDGVASVSLASDHAAAIKTDGTLWAWGANGYGQLGDGTTTDSAVPIKVMDDVSSVSFGYRSSSATKKDGSLWAWGAFGLRTTPVRQYLG